MSLSKEFVDRAIAALEERTKGAGCSFCQSDGWDLLNNGLVQLVFDEGDGAPEGGAKSFSAISLVCKTCGHISFMSPKTLGLLNDEPGPSRSRRANSASGKRKAKKATRAPNKSAAKKKKA